MTRIIESFAEISDKYDLALVDLWGCVHNGQEIYPHAQQALCDYRARGGKVVLLTNAPRTAASVKNRLDQMGLDHAAYDLIVTSGDATQEAMLTGAVGHQVWHLGPSKDDDLFDDLPDWASDHPPVHRVSYDQAQGIVCTGLLDETRESPDDYRGKLLAAKTRGLKMLCANPDIVVDLGDTRLFCAGALGELYREMGGETLYFGKPHPPVYDLARRRAVQAGLEFDAARMIAIGDGIHTDIKGAQGEAMDALFITGGLAADQFGPDVQTPDADLLASWLNDQQILPAYSIGRLR